ncbi:MAG: hypothetical protein FWG18_02410 [Alphaproteobacteria bacterium]|nr:hypothetical protein [Alphaproteobacteria bacterium]
MATKTTKKPATRTAAKPAPAMAAPATPCCGGCACRCGGFWRFVKKLIIFIIIFALGFAACKFMCMHKHWGMGMKRMQFVNGCLDTSKIRCPRMLDKVQQMDLNGDGCITKAEMMEWKKTKRAEFRAEREEDCPYGGTDAE